MANRELVIVRKPVVAFVAMVAIASNALLSRHGEFSVAQPGDGTRAATDSEVSEEVKGAGQGV